MEMIQIVKQIKSRNKDEFHNIRLAYDEMGYLIPHKTTCSCKHQIFRKESEADYCYHILLAHKEVKEEIKRWKNQNNKKNGNGGKS